VVQVGKVVKKKEVEAIVVEIVQRKLRKLRKSLLGKVVVYSNLVTKVKELAKQLGCNVYHHHVAGKVDMLGGFVAGN
jgi:hypothetical protein